MRKKIAHKTYYVKMKKNLRGQNKKKIAQNKESFWVEFKKFLMDGIGAVGVLTFITGLIFSLTPLNLECLGFEIYFLFRMTGIFFLLITWLRAFDYLEHREILKKLRR